MHMALRHISMLSPWLDVTEQDVRLTQHAIEHIIGESNMLFLPSSEMHGKLGVSTDLGLLLQGAQEGQRSRLPAHDYEVVEQAVQLHNQLLDGHVVPQLLLDLHRSVSLSRVVQHGLEVAPFFDVRLHETDVVQVVSVGDCYAAGQADEVLVVGRAA